MLTYNSQLKKLALPEYGRNIQQMVDYCCTIQDREERNKCAHSIINTMSNLFPQLNQEADYKHKLWDHLAIMSDFKLDVDYPYEVIKPENLDTKPEPIAYKLENIKMRHYGKIVGQMIERACEYPDGDEKDALIMLIANHMKKLIYQINNEDDIKHLFPSEYGWVVRCDKEHSDFIFNKCLNYGKNKNFGYRVD